MKKKSAKPMATNADRYRFRAIRQHFVALQRRFGRQNWWPARYRMEVVLGAYLIQNTAWRNAELALANLRKINGFALHTLRQRSEVELARVVRPAGFFRQKAKAIKEFVRFVDSEYLGSLQKLFRKRSADGMFALRQELLRLRGVGKETADSILLYAGNYPIFVVDTYARRIFSRHELFAANQGYDEIRAAVEHALSANRLQPGKERRTGHTPSRMSAAKRTATAQALNEFHALLVQVGKNFCHRTNPSCELCPLRKFHHDVLAGR